MRQIISIIVIFTISGVAAGANSYTLESIQSFARANYPAIRQFELIDTRLRISPLPMPLPHGRRRYPCPDRPHTRVT